MEDIRKIKLVENELGLTNVHLFSISYHNRKILFATVDREEKNKWIKHISRQMIKPTVLLSD